MAGNVDVGGGGSCDVRYQLNGNRTEDNRPRLLMHDKDAKKVKVTCEGKVVYEQPLKQQPRQVVVEWMNS